MRGTGLDRDGFIAREGDLARVPPAFAPVVEAAKAAILRAFGPHHPHSAYLYGSIPRGTAVPGTSDLDVLLALHDEPSDADRAVASSLEDALDGRFPQINGAALVRLRMANAERHAGLDPAGYRLPAAAAVQRHFEERLSGSAEPAILVAEVSGTVAGMTEVVVMPAPPDYQILVPRRMAEVHTVVLGRYRGKGIGKALVAAAERLAAQRGVSHLLAPILAPNTQAISFYSDAGFGQHGIILSKRVGLDGD